MKEIQLEGMLNILNNYHPDEIVDKWIWHFDNSQWMLPEGLVMNSFGRC